MVPRIVVASPAYLLRMGTPKGPADLTAHRCLGYSNFVGGDHWTLRNRATGECDNWDVVGELAALGEGVAFLPRLGRRWPPEIWLTAFYLPDEALPAKVLRFTRFIERS